MNQIPPSPCPECGYIHDAALSTDQGQPPRPGDFSICSNCAALMQYGDDMRLQAADQATEAKVMASITPELLAFAVAIRIRYQHRQTCPACRAQQNCHLN